MPVVTIDKLDETRQLIATRLKEAGISWDAASRKIGRNAAYVHQYLFRGSPKVLPEDARRDMARLIGVKEEMLRPKETVKHGEEVVPLPRVTRGGFRDLGVYRVGSVSQPPVASVEAERYVARPDTLVGVHGAFAARLLADEFAHGWRQGDILYFDPSDIPQPGEMACIELDNAHRVVGLFVGFDGPQKAKLADGEQKVHSLAYQRLAREVGVSRRY